MLHAPLALLAGLFAITLLVASPEGGFAASDLMSGASLQGLATLR
ncbi:MAG: hypothetical protein NXH79_05905 [Rhodobacteraceae bacterium]|nr:hypothetical protein [Paracoccaceae bacterium]